MLPASGVSTRTDVIASVTSPMWTVSRKRSLYFWPHVVVVSNGSWNSCSSRPHLFVFTPYGSVIMRRGAVPRNAEIKDPSTHPPKAECGCLLGGVIENGRTGNPLTLWTAPVLVPVWVWVHILGDPHSVQLRNATTTRTHPPPPWGEPGVGVLDNVPDRRPK